jgi:hypothetical protein
MNVNAILEKSYKPKEPPPEGQNPSVVESQLAFAKEKEERAKWLQNAFTKDLLSTIDNKIDELVSSAIAFSLETQGQSSENNQVASRKLAQVSTLKEIQYYARTGQV